MGPQHLKRALREDRDEGDKAALEVTTELIAAEFDGPDESAIQVCGNTSTCASATAHLLRVPCGYPRHRVELADHIYQIDECLNSPVDIPGQSIKQFRDVCWECYREFETANKGGPEHPVASERYFKLLCRHWRFCMQNRIDPRDKDVPKRWSHCGHHNFRSTA